MVAVVEFALPPIKQFQGALFLRDFVAEIVGPAAISVDIIEMLVKIFREQLRDYVEIFIVMRGEPARVRLGHCRGAVVRRSMLGNFELTRAQHFRRDSSLRRSNRSTNRALRAEWRAGGSIRSKLSRPDGQLDFSAAALHAFEGLRQFSQSDFFCYEVLPDDIAASNGFESFADKTRRVMKGRDQFDFGIVNGGGIDRHIRSRRQAAEEIYDAAAADHGQRLLPSRGISGCFNNGIRPSVILCQRFHGGDNV